MVNTTLYPVMKQPQVANVIAESKSEFFRPKPQIKVVLVLT
jgi:hypothetical protein